MKQCGEIIVDFNFSGMVRYASNENLHDVDN